MINNTQSVFGGRGFVGSYYVKHLTGRLGDEVYRCHLGDEVYLQDRDDLVPKTNNIVWFISTVDNYSVFSSPTLDIHTNQILLVKMLENAKNKFGSDFIVNYISTWFVYGTDSASAITERQVPNPKGFYSITKYAAEMLLSSYCNTFDARYRIIRLANIMGVGDKKTSKKKNAVQYMIETLARGGTVDLYKVPTIRDFIDVRDCARAIGYVTTGGDMNSIYNVGSGIPTNVNGLILSVHEDVGGVVNMIEVPKFHSTVQSSRFFMDISKLESLGYRPVSGLYDTVQWVISGVIRG